MDAASEYAPFMRTTGEEDTADRDPGDPRILVSTLGIAGEGLNLMRANYCILVELAWSRGAEDQSYYRVHRSG